MVVGGRIGFVDYNDTSTDDRNIYAYGKTQRTNAALTDTTVHTAGGSAIRFEPTYSAEAFQYSFDTPTGNIQNKTMAVAVWCKINSTAYYASDWDMPSLSVLYDGATTITSTATTGTDWQLLSVTFTPTTTTGKITVTLAGRTDAVGADRYFYFDDISVLYPAGYKLDLGGLDIWDNASPVLPPIATVIAAADIWAVDKSSLTGVGTIGKHVGELENPTIVLDGGIIV
jgi:hypothetical protein